MCTERTARLQRGLASVEFALALPAFLMLIVMLFAMTAALRAKHQVLDAARVGAWRHATGTDTWLSSVIGTSRTVLGAPIVVGGESHPQRREYDTLEIMRRRGRRDYRDVNGLTATLNTPTHGGSEAPTVSLFIPAYRLRDWTFVIRGNYGLVTGPAWEGRTMPIGYDNYLHRKLDSRVVFPGFFPCAGGPVNSGQSSCR
jgi:hypothetical protein